MVIATLLQESLAVSLGLLAEAGFEEKVQADYTALTTDTEGQYRRAFDTAWQHAQERLAPDHIAVLRTHTPFQEAVVHGLLEPGQGFDVQCTMSLLGDDYAAAVRPLRRFFSRLEDYLLDDAHWGPLLERHQELSLQGAIQDVLDQRQLHIGVAEVIRRVQTQLVGAGAIAQDGSVAAGANGTAVGRDFHQLILNQLIVQGAGAAEPESLRQRYLTRLLRQCYALPLAALGGEAGPNQTVTLDQVYIALNTTIAVKPSLLDAIRRGDPIDRAQLQALPTEADEMPRALRRLRRNHEADEPQPLSALDALRLTPHMALLGDPGAGKSTFVRIITAQLAAGRSIEGMASGLLPIFVTLRDVAPRLATLDLDALAPADHEAALAEALRDHMLADLISLDAAGFEAGLLDALNQQTCILVFDGLDEVPHPYRGRVRQAVMAVIERYQPPHVLITCRVRSYVGDAVLPGVEDWTLASFDRQQIQDFSQAWYRAHAGLGRLTTAQAEDRAADLVQAALGPALREIASNPMLLTTMALIHYQDVGLPEESVRLYTRAVDILLYRWHQQKVGHDDLDDLLRQDRLLREVMERLAYEAHGNQGEDASDTSPDVSRHEAQDILEDAFGDLAQARRFLDYVDQRAGLLIGRGGQESRPATYTFPHRTFQEYLAGCYLLNGNDSDRIAEFYDRAGDGDSWNLVAQHGAEELFYNTRNGASQLLYLAAHLLRPELTTAQDQRAALWSAHMAVLIGRERIERDASHFIDGQHYLQQLLASCEHLLGGVLSAPERGQAGRLLAALGDPRFDLQRWSLPNDEMLGFVAVPEGPFTMGSDASEDSSMYAASPAHELTLPTFLMARYPVTVSQFQAFVDASGYEPSDSDCLNGIPNHPVVWVSWLDAMTYCEWLTTQFRARLSDLPSQLADFIQGESAQVLLPSEAEWEKAARGPNGLIYPWGNMFDSDCANYSASGIQGTSTVGCFPKGASLASGIEDLSGNVWEWTRSIREDYPYPSNPSDRVGREDLQSSGDALRVLRGGSFYYYPRRVRCAVRSASNARYAHYGVGFRVVLSALP